MKHTIFKKFLKATVVLLMSMIASHVSAAKLYKWVDANGNISYQDLPPPKSATILSEKDVDSSRSTEEENDNSLPEIVVYSVDDCTLCEQFVNLLKQNKVPHIELPLEDDRQAQSRILERASSIIVPTIFIGDEIIQGGTEDQLKEQLTSAGYTIEESEKPKSSNRLTLDDQVQAIILQNNDLN